MHNLYFYYSNQTHIISANGTLHVHFEFRKIVENVVSFETLYHITTPNWVFKAVHHQDCCGSMRFMRKRLKRRSSWVYAAHRFCRSPSFESIVPALIMQNMPKVIRKYYEIFDWIIFRFIRFCFIESIQTLHRKQIMPFWHLFTSHSYHYNLVIYLELIIL